MKINPIFKSIFLTLLIGLVVSCDKDFNEIGADLLDDIHYQYDKSYYSVLAYDAPTGVVQSSNLPINSLGFYKNSVFGSTTASFVTQLELDNVDPKFYDVTAVDSVYLYVPYFSRLIATDATSGDSTYELDSIHGKNNKLKLSVYRSEYFLRNLDPTAGLQEQQRYYSDERMLVEGISTAGGLLNDPTIPSQYDQFEFSANQIKLFKTNPVTGLLTTEVRERFAPGIYMDLDESKFFTSIIQAPAGSLVNNTVFKNYFKGLYIKAEADAAEENAMARLDFSKGKIVIIYKGKDSATDTAPAKRKTLTLSMKGNTVNFLENINTTEYSSAINNSNTINGDEKLYLKGGQGSMAVLKLFSGNELDDLRDQDERGTLLINEASLVFTIDNEEMFDVYPNPLGDETKVDFEPNRIYLYDLNNKRPIIDYNFDGTTNSFNTKLDKFIHDGIITKVNKKGTQYKIRITNHIRNLIVRDSTNVNLGLVVTESINNVSNIKLRNNFSAFGTEVKFIPAMSVVSPLGTILWGNNITNPANNDKKLRLELVYTKPD